jgi:hypothetical protein
MRKHKHIALNHGPQKLLIVVLLLIYYYKISSNILGPLRL